MKYINLFESNKTGVYYFIPYVDDSIARLAIKKINISEKIKDIILSNDLFFNTLKRNAKYGIGFFISIKNFDTPYPFTFWACSKENTKSDAFIHYQKNHDANWIYGGEIKLEDWEISSDKYNL